LKRTVEGFERKSLKARIKGNVISKGQTLVFLGFPILLLILDKEIEGKEGEKSSVGDLIMTILESLGRWKKGTFKIINSNFRDSSRLKLSWSRLLPCNFFLTSECQFLVYW